MCDHCFMAFKLRIPTTVRTLISKAVIRTKSEITTNFQIPSGLSFLSLSSSKDITIELTYCKIIFTAHLIQLMAILLTCLQVIVSLDHGEAVEVYVTFHILQNCQYRICLWWKLKEKHVNGSALLLCLVTIPVYLSLKCKRKLLKVWINTRFLVIKRKTNVFYRRSQRTCFKACVPDVLQDVRSVSYCAVCLGISLNILFSFKL